MATETGSTYISESMIAIVEISTTARSMKVFPGRCINDRGQEIAHETGNTYIAAVAQRGGLLALGADCNFAAPEVVRYLMSLITLIFRPFCRPLLTDARGDLPLPSIPSMLLSR